MQQKILKVPKIFINIKKYQKYNEISKNIKIGKIPNIFKNTIN